MNVYSSPAMAAAAGSQSTLRSTPARVPRNPGHGLRDNVGHVSRVHDMGGQTGFGPVPAEDDGRFFHADWETRVYAIVRTLQARGVINKEFDELRDAIERIPPAEYLTLSYYERWLRGTEMLLAEKGLLTDDTAYR